MSYPQAGPCCATYVADLCVQWKQALSKNKLNITWNFMGTSYPYVSSKERSCFMDKGMTDLDRTWYVGMVYDLVLRPTVASKSLKASVSHKWNRIYFLNIVFHWQLDEFYRQSSTHEFIYFGQMSSESSMDDKRAWVARKWRKEMTCSWCVGMTGSVCLCIYSLRLDKKWEQ